jgi:hypothetical protein
MHAAWVNAKETSKDCARCHSEHNGADFQLVHWEPSREAMDHSKTGFALTGKHAGVACEKCHKPENIPAAARSGILVKELKQTYLGLRQECISCHQDEHRGQLGKDCARCHAVEAWKPASLFSHAKTKYPLTGAHVKTACAKCHVFLADTKPYVKYTGLAFTKCSACHADPHKGSFPAACESCHNTNNWHQIAQLQGFDHSKTKYPLLGKHATVGCADCHTHGDFKTSVPFVKCTDCHKDAHKGQFRGRTDGGECAACHTVNSAPVEFKGNSVVLQVSARTQEIPNDYVWVFAGGEPPTAFLKKIGVGFGLRDMTSEAGKEARNASLSKKHLVEV